jgi:anion-transporting  ArsA/GET3 family ATPase
MFGGFRDRAEATYRLLQTPGTAFLVVAAPEPDALREASYFVERLAAERMPLAGLVLNRVHMPLAVPLSAARALGAAETLDSAPNDGADSDRDLAVAALKLHADRMQVHQREQRVAATFTSVNPAVPVAEVAALPLDVHDLAGLRDVGESLARN